tara:strand:+ start:1103 stop:1849 length:747 start_codon:yes stop_codon:yes gene_type:complete
MRIINFFKKLLKFVIHITNTRAIISDIGDFDICANNDQSEKIRLWFKKILDIIEVKTIIRGDVKQGNFLIISNHSSWLDIIILGSTFKTTFLSKIEVSKWPVIGKITTAVDMLFINRGEKDAASQAVSGISKFLSHNRNVAIFPEGTSSGGKKLLNFKPRLFASCIDTGCPVQCVIIKYPYKNKNIHPSVPFVRGNSLFLNILRVLFQRDLVAEITITELIETKGKDRKSISNECYQTIKNILESNVN